MYARFTSNRIIYTHVQQKVLKTARRGKEHAWRESIVESAQYNSLVFLRTHRLTHAHTVARTAGTPPLSAGTHIHTHTHAHTSLARTAGSTATVSWHDFFSPWTSDGSNQPGM